MSKHTILRALLEVEMSKKCTLLWPEAHVEVKMYSGAKHISSHNVTVTACSGHFLTIRIPFHVEKVHTVLVRSTFGSKTCEQLEVLSFFRCSDVVLLTDGYRNIKLDGWIAIKLVQLGKFVTLLKFVELVSIYLSLFNSLS